MPKTEKKFTKTKTIKLTEQQAESWDCNKVKDFLDGKLNQTNPILEPLIKKLIPEFIQANLTIDLTQDEVDYVTKIANEVINSA